MWVARGCMAARWAVVGIVSPPPGQVWAEADYTGGWSVWALCENTPKYGVGLALRFLPK